MKRNGPTLDPELRLKQSILWVVGPVVVTLALSIPVVFLLAGEKFTNYSATVGPIVSAAVAGLIGYIAGKASK